MLWSNLSFNLPALLLWLAWLGAWVGLALLIYLGLEAASWALRRLAARHSKPRLAKPRRPH